MSKRPAPSFTAAEMRLFDDLTAKACSQSQIDRITARMGLTRFLKQHGREKCDHMLAVVKAKDKAKMEGRRYVYRS